VTARRGDDRPWEAAADRGPDIDPDRHGPLIWVLQGHRTGDNLQLAALARALGWRWQARALAWRRPLPVWTPFYGRAAGLRWLTAASRAAMRPPWPDLVLSIGWRSVPVARWIGRRTGARLVHLGRPRAPFGAFDLILSTPQYQLPAAGNVVALTGPLRTHDARDLAAAAARWAPRLASLPRPWLAVLVGGDTPRARLAPAAAAAWAARCSAQAVAQGGALLVATSPRTPPQVADAVFSSIGAPAFRYRWGDGGENPYAAFLALADGFAVTGDSVSMSQEAASTGRPLHVFPLQDTDSRLRRALRGIGRGLFATDAAMAGPMAGLMAGPMAGLVAGPMAGLVAGLVRAGIVYPPRAPEAYFARLQARGAAGPLGVAVAAPPDGAADMARAVQAVRALFDAPCAPGR